MKIFPTILLFVLIGAVRMQEPPAGFGNKTFHLNSQDEFSWKDAQQYCRSNGWSLATIMNKEERDQLVSQVRQEGRGANYWIGATKVENKWIWFPRNESLTYTDWEDDQPDGNTNKDGPENCVHLWNSAGYSWNDSKCKFLFFTACEENANQ